MIRIGESQEPKPWQSCALCSDKRIFRSPKDFSRHLRQYHCTKEGGSFVCRYGRNGVCPSLPVEGVSDTDYEAHVERNHAKLEGVKQEIIPANHEDSLVPIQRIPPISFPHEKKFTVYDSNQNLPAVLNDPRYTRRLHDFFTKTWGEDFIPCNVPPLTLLPIIPKVYFDDYLKRIELGSKVHHKIKKGLSEAKSGSDEGAQPGDTGFTAAAIAAAKRHSIPDKVLSNIQQIPKVFMQADFSLEDQQTFNAVLPWALISEPKQAVKDRAGLLNMPRNSSKLLQEKLTHYLDITEVNLAHQISLRSEDFFSAMASQDQLQDHVGETCAEIRHLRMKVKRAEDVLCRKHLEVLRLTSLRSKYLTVFNKLKLMAAVHQTQPTIQLLLSTSDFVAALDLIATTQEVLQQELVGVQSFRHLGSQLAEMERVIERMMEADFKEFISTNIVKPADELFDNGHLVDEDRLVCVLFGLLRKHKFHFIHLYRDEAYTTIKSTIRQTVYGVVSENLEQEEESQSLAEAMRGLDFVQWMNMLAKVFEAAADVLRRMKSLRKKSNVRSTTEVLIIIEDLQVDQIEVLSLINECEQDQVLHKSIVAVLAIAAGHGRPQLVSDLDDATLREIDDDTEELQTACGDMDILITPSELTKLSQESRELLCSACEMAQVRCAKLINIRSKAGFLDSLTSTEFVNLTRMVEDFVVDCEGICGRQSHSLRATLLSQAKKFIERFHEERMNKLGLILDNERWKQADVPPEFQSLVDSLVYGIKPIGRESKFSIAPVIQDQRPSGYLIVNGESYTVVGTVLLLLKMVVEYCQCVDDTPMLVTDIMNKLFEILKLFNSRTCQLVLGAGALQLVGLKTITVKHLVLATRCLEVIILHIPTFKGHFEERLPPKQYVLLSQFDQILKDYTNHKQEIYGKIVSLMDDVFTTHFAKWEVRPPMPSHSMRGAVKQVTKLHESMSSLLPEKQIEVVFRDIKKVFKNCLAQKLERLGVFNDGGPQHGLVTSDLAFFAESLKSLKGLSEMSRGLDDIWRIVNELRTIKRSRDSPNAVRKSSLPSSSSSSR